jgi:ABC-type dipeptide/oligopeptide/nickel transport system ATPase component
MAELKINIGDEYKIKIEDGKEFKDSIFNDIYEKAALNIDEIINQAEIKRKKTEGIKTSYVSDFSISDDYNNIITFTGERGSGKSSSMVSFGEALVNKNNSIIVGDFFKDYININKKEFLSIEMIDPSLFGTKDTLLEIIISKMFLKFQKDLDKSNNSDLDYDKKRKLIVLFQKVFENLKTLHNEKKIIYEQEAIEALSKLANSTNLKENFKLLIDHYLEYFKISEGFLLIAIDDFDLNIQGAYSMLEEIRQFLIQSNIIILMACKIEQLQDSVKQSIIKNYKELIDYEKEKINDSPDNKAEKYLDKLFPIAHRVSTPKFNLLFSNNEMEDDESENDENEKQNKNSFIVKDKNKNIIIESKSIEEGLLEYLYKKNDLFISKSNYSLSSIMPNTLRELSNFVGFLSINNGVLSLKNYFLVEIKNDLNTLYSSLFEELEFIETSYINQYIVNWIGTNHPTIESLKNDYIDIKILNRESRNFNYRNISNNEYLKIEPIIKASNNKNSSFADVLALIKQLQKSSLITEKENNKFLYYLKIYYSIRFKIIELEKKDSFYKLTSTLITNESIKVFRKQREGGKDRQIFQIFQFDKLLDKLKNEELSLEAYYWICFFIGQLGLPYENFRNEDIVFYKTPINKTGNQFKEAQFNWFSFIVNSLEPEIVKSRLVPENLWNNENKLLDELIDWNANLNNDYYQLFNIQLFDEIISIWKDYNHGYKISLGETYEEAMYINFSPDALKFVFDSIKRKYPYLKINQDLLINNPILKFWTKNRNELKEIINEIFISEKLEINPENQIVTQKLNVLQKWVLNHYIDTLPNAVGKSRTTYNLITKLNKNNFEKSFIDSISVLKLSYNKSKENNNTIAFRIVEILKEYLKNNG